MTQGLRGIHSLKDSSRKGGSVRTTAPNSMGEPRASGRLLRRFFFEDKPELVAPRLLGKLLVHRIEDENGTKYLGGRIVEVEAYLGPHNEQPDPAAHAYRGPTPRNQILYGPAGHAYVYAIYGRYFCANISCETEGRAGSVLLRALEPVGPPESLRQMAINRGVAPGGALCQLTSGPSRLCQALALNRLTHNGLDLVDPNSPLQVREDGTVVSEALVTVRIGIRHAVDLPLRFAYPGHNCVSGPRNLTGTSIPVGYDFIKGKAIRRA